MTTTTWEKMKRTEPGLEMLEDEARDAGRRGASWWSTWTDRLYETLSKLVGPMSNGRLRSAKDFERARKALLLTWASPDGAANTPPWEIEGETVPMAPAFGQAVKP